MHKFKFYTAGGVDQAIIATGEDLLHLDELDPKLWVALSMPVKGVDVDARTLELLDTDKDGMVRLPEILAAVALIKAAYKTPGTLLEGGDVIPLSALAPGPTFDAAKRVLKELGRSSDDLRLEDVTDQLKIFAATANNGDGIVTAEATSDAALAGVVKDVVATQGGVDDRSGKPGADAGKLKTFYVEVQAASAWLERGAKPDVQVAGEGTAAALAALEAVRAKVDDFFARCRLASFDAKAADAAGLGDAELSALAGKDLGAASPELIRLPLAKAAPGRALVFAEIANPAWVTAIRSFESKAVVPLLGARASLSENDWQALCGKLAVAAAWMKDQPAGKVAALPAARIRELAAGTAEASLAAAIALDLEAKPAFDRINELEKLVRLQRDFGRVLRNFVNFGDFYARKGAVFQDGTLFLDGRGCELCCEVVDAAKHGVLAPMAGAFLAYCDLSRQGAKKQIVAAFTAGDSDNLFVGRNGMYKDRAGQDWHATITRIVDNPISVRQAFWAPYKKFVRMIEDQVSKRASAADAASQAKLAGAAEKVATIDQIKPPAPPEPPKKLDIGVVAAIGVAVGGIGAMVAGILAAFFGLGAWMPIGFLALLLMISGPSMLLAYMKLRRRNLGPLLDAGGWAINGRAKITVPFGGALTKVAQLPKGAEHAKRDPYAEKSRPWRLYATLLIILVLAASWYFGKLDKFLPKQVRSVTVLGTSAPAYKEPVPVPVVLTPAPGTTTLPAVTPPPGK